MRANMTEHASTTPAPSARVSVGRASGGCARARRAKESVTAVDDTRPPNSAVAITPRAGPSQRMAM
jgi:hypothetical protein